MIPTDADEGQALDYKAVRKVTGATADFASLTDDRVCFANIAGERLIIGIEDGENTAPPVQRIEPGPLDRLRAYPIVGDDELEAVEPLRVAPARPCAPLPANAVLYGHQVAGRAGQRC